MDAIQARQELARRELARRKSSTSTSVAPTQKQPSYLPFQGAVKIGSDVGRKVGNAYGDIREGVQEGVSKMLPNSPEMERKQSLNIPNPMLPIMPMKVGEFTPRESAKELAGIGVDEVATLGAMGGARAAKGAAKGAFNAMKSVPSKLARPFTKIGAEITPRAEELITSRVRGMHPEALEALGVPNESRQIAKRVSERVGLDELPSREMADKYYGNVIESIPDDVQIGTSNLQQAVSDPANQSQATRKIKELLGRSRLNDKGVLESAPLSKQEYNDIRGMLNNMDPRGETPSIQSVKQALDADAEIVVPDINKAKGTFQVSRELSKADKYLEKPNLGSNLQRQLEEAGKMGNVQKREEMSRLIGPEAEQIFKDIRKTQGVKALAKVAGSIGLFGGGYKVFNALTGKHDSNFGGE